MENVKKTQNGVLYMRLADDIYFYIRENGIKPGMRIPSERKLAEMFQTSRTSVREAVRILQNKGIIEVQIGNGMYLRETLSDDNCRIELWKVDYMEVLDIKTTLEYSIISELCAYVSPADLLAIEDALKELEASYYLGVFNQQADYLFHQRIRLCSKNQTLIQLIENLLRTLDDYALEEKELYKTWLDTVPYHRDLYEAICCRNKKDAHTAFYKIYELDLEALQKLPVTGKIKAG